MINNKTPHLSPGLSYPPNEWTSPSNEGPDILSLPTPQSAGSAEVGVLPPLSGAGLLFSFYYMELGRRGKNYWPPVHPRLSL